MKTVTSAADDDDWETDPDFVVSIMAYVVCIHVAQLCAHNCVYVHVPLAVHCESDATFLFDQLKTLLYMVMSRDCCFH